MKHGKCNDRTVIRKICLFVLIMCILLIFHMPNYKMQFFYLIFSVIFSIIISYFIPKRQGDIIGRFILSFFGVIIIIDGIIMLACRFPRDNVKSSFKSDFYSNKKVMIIVPHEDDDINLTGGVIEQYTDAGSDVYVVFTTVGDYFIPGKIRVKESINTLERMGVPEKNIIFLGYGDQWKPQRQNGKIINHIYNSTDENASWTSHAGYSETYATEVHPPYNKCRYSRKSFVDGVESVIEEYRPQVIYAVDYDKHVDHRATDLFFEEAMGNILKKDNKYRPDIYKGFCYSTAWTAEDDFMGINIKSTKNPDNAEYMNENHAYRWADRIREPVSQDGLSAILSRNSIYNNLKCEKSQDAKLNAGKIINGDKVFWQRRSDSILYNAKISYNDHKVSVLNDFKLFDSSDISNDDLSVNTGLMQIKNGYSININMNKADKCKDVVLYDNPDASSNILAGYILFSNGQKKDFSALLANGTGTIVNCSQMDVTGMKIFITETEGTNPGLCEIEAYDHDIVKGVVPEYIKLMDSTGNFVYDYCIPRKKEAEFRVYSYPNNSVLEADKLNISIDGDKQCSYKVGEDNSIAVRCPKGRKCTLSVTYDNKLKDSVYISNPVSVQRNLLNILQRADYLLNVRSRFFDSQIEYYSKIVIAFESRI